MQLKDTFLYYFIAYADATPNAIALQSNEKKMTYKELYDEAVYQSVLLRKSGVKSNDIVAVICESKMENIVNCLAIGLAGGVFLAIDENIPRERFRLIKEDSQICIAVCQKPKEWLKDISILDLHGYIDPEMLSVSDVCGENMYMLYTSGTSGEPKAVMIHHEAFNVFRNSINRVVEYDKREVSFLATTSLAFDISILETLVTLSYGGRVVCVDDDKKMIPSYIKEVIQFSDVNTVQFTPTYVRFLMKHFNNDLSFMRNINKILIGGEIFTNEIKDCLLKLPHTEVYNCYGPTEATIWATVEKVNETEEVLIGYPLDGYEVFVEGEEVGEINIRGEVVAKGYYLQEKLTSEKFYVSAGKRTYRTGDLGKMSADGRIVFCGRKDRQVKIKGYRVELDEIESRISKIFCEIYKAAVVLDDGKLICIYQLEHDISRKDFFEKMKGYLPSYMIPMYFYRVDEFPLLTNGKTDYKKLKSFYSRSIL